MSIQSIKIKRLFRKSTFLLHFFLLTTLLTGASIQLAPSAWSDSSNGTAVTENGMKFIQISAKSKEKRSEIANTGVSIESVLSDSVWALANDKQINALTEQGFQILGNLALDTARGDDKTTFNFPEGDARFHTYEQLLSALEKIQTAYPEFTAIQSIGKSIEGRDIWAIHFNTSSDDLKSGKSNKPGILFTGNHHAREHLSLEVPLMLAEYLANNHGEAAVNDLLMTRDIWIIPMVNPDGAEFDIATGRYKWWRKNRRNNQDGTFGVDLNRNYGYKWGTGGADSNTSSEVYKGTEAFSEPETQAIRDFVSSHSNLKALLTFHTFSELILFPWGHTYDGIANAKDLAVFQKMAKTMAEWNHYKPQQSSDLYIASGDTTDWAYGEHGIFAFTFELSPGSMFGGGFYPGAKVIDRVFKDNLKPCLYLIQMAGDPYQVLLTNQE